MTSLSRKKHPTTRQSFLTGNSLGLTKGRGLRVEGREPSLRLRLGSLVLLTIFAVAVPANAEVTRLKWGGESPATKKIAKEQGTTTLKFVKPGITASSTNKSSDAHIKLAAYEGDAPRLTSGRTTEFETRSVVVNREESTDENFRSAQLQPIKSGNNSNGKIEDGLRSPFADNPEEPPKLEQPSFEPPNKNDGTQPNDNSQTIPQPNNNNAQPLPDNASDAGQFQPVLPAGPAPDQSPPTPLGAETAEIEADGVKAKESCEKSLQNLRAYTVDKVSLAISIRGTEGEDFPFECSIDDGTMHGGRCWDQTTYMWKASALCHKPLYFEDEQLERYGHSFSPCFQPFISGAHFFCHVPVLPYCMGVEPPCECVYSLGHYRPGNCAPYMCNPIPLSARGALFQAGAVTGVAAALS